MHSTQQIILASSSPRRKELLSDAGLTFKVVSPDCDETVLPNEQPESMVRRLSLLKAQTVAEKFPDALIIAADTTVFLNQEILGKPESDKDAVLMLEKLSGKFHQVWGGIAILCKQKEISIVQSFYSEVKMMELTPELITWYVATGEPMDKAGSYAIQGKGLQLVESVKGSYSNVVGLNISWVMQQLRELEA